MLHKEPGDSAALVDKWPDDQSLATSSAGHGIFLSGGRNASENTTLYSPAPSMVATGLLRDVTVRGTVAGNPNRLWAAQSLGSLGLRWYGTVPRGTELTTRQFTMWLLQRQ